VSTAQIIPFNPLDKRNLGASVAEALVGSKAQPLGKLTSFVGVGIYAIYYCGPFSAYQKISKPNQIDPGAPTVPIYVGKAVPAGARKGNALADPLRSKALFNRLTEHAESIRLTPNLSIDDFSCRYLIVDEIWIPLGESLMITKFGPLWNSLIDGFGNHDPGKGRYAGLRPRWDVLHPGRSWAEKCQARPETYADIERDVRNHLKSTQVPQSPHFVGPDQ
jgi:hypothetical protein